MGKEPVVALDPVMALEHMEVQEPVEVQEPWRRRLVQPFQFTVQYQTGKVNTNTDALSRDLELKRQVCCRVIPYLIKPP